MELTQVESKDFWIAALRREKADFRTAAGEPDLSAPVPSCPEWTVRQLVAHLGRVYSWVHQVVQAGGEQPARQNPQPPDDVLRWFDDVFAGLIATLEVIDPGAPAWNWSMQPHLAGFWPRRMAHETAVHRWDAQMVSGMTQPVEAALAADGVSEVLDTLLSAGKGKTKGEIDSGVTGLVRLTATDLDHTWLVRLRAGGLALLDERTVLDEPAGAQTGVGGSASDLDLGLWGRLPTSVFLVEGDPARFEALRVG